MEAVSRSRIAEAERVYREPLDADELAYFADLGPDYFDRLSFGFYDCVLYRHRSDGHTEWLTAEGWMPAVPSKEEFLHERLISPQRAGRIARALGLPFFSVVSSSRPPSTHW